MNEQNLDLAEMKKMSGFADFMHDLDEIVSEEPGFGHNSEMPRESDSDQQQTHMIYTGPKIEKAH